eukprot:6087633-Alexandrium_andersonii.AAC.1
MFERPTQLCMFWVREAAQQPAAKCCKRLQRLLHVCRYALGAGPERGGEDLGSAGISGDLLK